MYLLSSPCILYNTGNVSHTRTVSAVYDTLHGGDFRKESVVTKPSRGTRLWVGIRASCSLRNIHEAVS